ncbi:MAG: hypothetical protein ABSE73_02840 [Planctomycetota bacterium]
MDNSPRVAPQRTFLIAFVLLAIAAGAGGVYLAEKLYYGPLREQERLVANLKSLVEQLTREIRIAEVAVISQTGEPPTTVFRFVEVDARHEPVAPPKVFKVAGEEVYFDALVIKFEEPFKPLDELPLKQQDLAPPLLHKAIIFFRRVFSEKQKPEDGFPLDTPGQPPGHYSRGEQPSAFEQQLWAQFWKLANDPKLAQAHGVRAAHGQAVSMKLQAGKHYILEQRLTGEMTIRAVDVPAEGKN